MKTNLKQLLLVYLVGVMVGVAVSAVIVDARSIDMSKAGVSLWIFLAVGACIILLQAMPAAIVIWSFILSRSKHD